MNKADSDRIQELCSRISTEEDRTKFLKLCEELNRLLSSKDRYKDTDDKDKDNEKSSGPGGGD
jgi:hypothetical protein